MEVKDVAFIHACYYLASGLWPLVHMPSFIKVTGEKVDLWLVRTVGMLVYVIGFFLFLTLIQNEITGSVKLLAVGCALGLTFIDIYYVHKKIISRVYYGDAALETLLIAGWTIAR